MLDLVKLTELTVLLQKAVLDKNIDEIQRLCIENNDFIFSMKPEKKNIQINEQLKKFIKTHQIAVQLVQNSHQTMQKQLYQSIKTRKSIVKYKGVKNAK